MEGEGLAQVSAALDVVYNASSSNQARSEASAKLAIKNWIVDLGTSVQPSDPHYLKEKIAILWVAVAKRIWGLELDRAAAATNSSSKSPVANKSSLFNGSNNNNNKHSEELDDDDSNSGNFDSDGWINMDELLVRMWESNPTTRELSLGVWRTLFEDLYILDDPVADKRASSLSAQCIEVVTAEPILNVMYEVPLKSLRKLRFGTEGWLNRWSSVLQECIERGFSDPEVAKFSLKLLQTLRTCLYWIFPLAIREANLLQRLSIALSCDNVDIKILAADCLHVLFTRTFSNDADFQAIIGAVFLPDGMRTLAQVYTSISIDIDHFDDKLYILSKKMVEMIVGLGEYLNLSKNRLPAETDLGQYLSLVLETTRHHSLVISGMSLQFWCSVLRVEKLNGKEQIEKLLPQLLELAAERCIKFEDVSEEHVSRQFLNMDFDTAPDTQVFLGNYRRFMEDIVRLIVCRLPADSMAYLENRMDLFFSSELGWQSLNSPKLEYAGNPAYFLAYSQFILVEAALRGVSRWKIWYNEPDKPQVLQKLSIIIERWCERLIAMSLHDPLLLRKHVQTLVQFAPLLRDVTQLMFRVLEKVLTACTFDYPPDATDDEREVIRDLRTSCGTELNRLAYMMPESLMQIYDDLERVIGETFASNKLSDHEAVAFKSFLLVVSQRSNINNKPEKFAKIVDPVLQSWTDEGTMKGLMDLPWFMERVGIVAIADYFRSRGVTADTDLLKAEMDQVGKDLKSELKSKWSALFPIRATRIFIQYTIEKLDHNSQEYKDLLALWKPRIQPILPHILQLVAQIEAYHNPANWTSLPAEVQSFVKYSCMERFWQVGVSTQTRDQFVDENVRAMHTLRDFADSVGHIIRYTREYAFLTLGSISQLEETMYEIPGMATNLWMALAGDSAGITSHSWRHMISLVLRNVIKNCPVYLMPSFLKEFLPPLLSKLDQVLLEKWEKVMQNGTVLVGDEDDASLSEEMMEEHLLRQLTAIVARLLIDLVGQLGGKAQPESSDPNNPQEVIRKTVLNNKEILAPFLTICTHIMSFRDNRCSFNSCLIMRNILSDILLKDPEVDNFICENVIKTCLDILNDKYFSEVHNEVGYVLTTVYTILRTRYQRPVQILLDQLPNVSGQTVSEFEIRLSSPKSLRQQRGEFLEFLAMARKSDSGDSYDMAKRESQQRKAEKQNEKKKLLTKKKTEDFIEAEEMEASMVNLFDEGYQ
ncbi:hypothetical protein DV113_003619 [Geotrichum candidum]|nr:hypothetical protein DV454_004524 [Geotrichum candidum]KAF5116929.1 hypothetical protein DV452_002514 [Geotrichum candidum]KAF7498331.1 hypothetical protein DV113_003619 [Geotrichum candidum]